MEMILKNPSLTVETLNEIRNKLDSNRLTADDLEVLDGFLSSIGARNFIINKMRDSGIFSYNDFIIQIKTPYEYQNPAVRGSVLGSILGAISTLKDYAKDNLNY
jgi:hypothetical protein